MWFVKSRRAQNDQDYETWVGGGLCPTLNAFDNGTETRSTVVIMDDMYGFSHTQGLNNQANANRFPTLRANGNGMAVSYGQSVRRLTPLECERLQGFPDGWTEGQADSHRYKQMGNAVAVPVVQWLIDGIVGVINDEQGS